jgi:hypothetical protein
MGLYIYIYIHTHTHIYIYIYKEDIGGCIYLANLKRNLYMHRKHLKIQYIPNWGIKPKDSKRIISHDALQIGAASSEFFVPCAKLVQNCIG